VHSVSDTPKSRSRRRMGVIGKKKATVKGGFKGFAQLCQLVRRVESAVTDSFYCVSS